MRNILINRAGELLCPACGSKEFSNRRTRGAKLLGGVAVGVGALAAPKRLQCLGCREYFKSPPLPVEGEWNEDVVLLVSSQKSFGSGVVLDNALRKAGVSLPPQEKKSIQDTAKSGGVAALPPMSATAANTVREQLKSPPFHVEVQRPSLPEDIDSESAGQEPMDVVTQLERLSALFEKGLLTQEEFESQKSKLLG